MFRYLAGVEIELFMKWFLLKTDSQLQKLSKLLNELPIIDIGGANSFVKYGYKNLSLGDKETYYFLREMLDYNQSKYGTDEVDVSLDYIAKCLSTSTRTQIRRIDALEKVFLIKKVRRKYKNTKYNINKQPLPDSTFLSTIIILVRRKRILQLINKYKFEIVTDKRENLYRLISNLYTNPFYKDIIKNLPSLNELSSPNF